MNDWIWFKRLIRSRPVGPALGFIAGAVVLAIVWWLWQGHEEPKHSN
jgi:hypothetical protein